MLLGGCFVLLCDDVARTLLTGEIPLGILTSFVGAALFLAAADAERLQGAADESRRAVVGLEHGLVRILAFATTGGLTCSGASPRSSRRDP